MIAIVLGIMAYVNKGVQRKMGAHYFKQFPKQLIKPYGAHTAPLSEENILSKINTINCEWFLRPKYAMSEMAETVSGSLPNAEAFIDWLDFDDVKRQLNKYSDAVHALNT